MSDGSSPMAGFIMLMVLFVLYFLPTFISAKRGHPNGTGIFLLNLFLGWTFIGWLVALIWSVSALEAGAPVPVKPEAAADTRLNQLQTLAALKDKGILSEAEFESEKAKLLKS
jgi:hypothetical protein